LDQPGAVHFPCRKTEWEQRGEDAYIGYGQRMLVTDRNDYALMAIRSIKFEAKVKDDG
jgi:type VI secretion system protein ImpE